MPYHEGKPELKIHPTFGKCRFNLGLDLAGKPRDCHRPATMEVAGTPLCDRHAEILMTSACRRNVII